MKKRDLVALISTALLIVSLLVLPRMAFAEKLLQELGVADLFTDHAHGTVPTLQYLGRYGGTVSTVAVQGYRAYIGDASRVQVLYISNPASPYLVGQVADIPGTVKGLAVSGPYLYVAAWDGGLRILDVSIPAHPVEIGHVVASSERAGNVFVVGNTAYVSDYARDAGGGMAIVDVSDPTHPVEVGFFSTPFANTLDAAVAGSYAFVVSYSDLRVVDVSQPAAPQLMGTCGLPSWAGAVAVSVQGNYAYVAARSAGLWIVNISNPTAPYVEGICYTPGGAQDVAAFGRHVLVADDTAGLRVVDVSNPAWPWAVASFDTPGHALGVAADSRCILIADQEWGLESLRLVGEDMPTATGTPTVGPSRTATAGPSPTPSVTLGPSPTPLSTPTPEPTATPSEPPIPTRTPGAEHRLWLPLVSSDRVDE